MSEKDFIENENESELLVDHPALQNFQEAFLERYRRRAEELEITIRYASGLS